MKIEKFAHFLLEFPRNIAWFLAVVCFLAIPSAVVAQNLTIDLDPAATKINFTLSATMHTVHGTFRLKGGEIRFDPGTGQMSGSIVVDATSGDTDNKSRDAKMHSDVLESGQFPEIVFTPKTVKGPVVQMLNQQKAAQLEIDGFFSLHGQDHAAAIPISVQPGPAGRMDIDAQFPVPYQAWGLKNPSTFVLKVGDTVNLDVHTTGRIVMSP